MRLYERYAKYERECYELDTQPQSFEDWEDGLIDYIESLEEQCYRINDNKEND